VALGEYGTARYPSVAENHGLGKAGCCRMVCHADGVLRCALVGWLGLPAQSRVLPRRCYLLRLDDLVRRLPGARTNESQLSCRVAVHVARVHCGVPRVLEYLPGHH